MAGIVRAPDRRGAIVVLVVCLGACVALSVLSARDAGHRSGAPRGEEVVALVPVLGEGPITFFGSHCASCHGEYGTIWPPGFLEGYAAGDLRSKVADMVKVRTGREGEARTVDALVAYLRSISDEGAFVAITGSSPGSLSGEATPGSRVEVITEDGPREARLEGHRWTGPAGRGAVVEKGARRARADLREAAYGASVVP